MSTIDEPAALARLRAIVPPTVRQACATLAARGHVAVCVGGAVRDALLGRDPGDWDVASSALPEEIIAIFPRTIPTGLQHGTVTVLLGHGEARLPVEITTFRGEGEYLDARRPSSVTLGVPLHEDLARRDLVVNAIAYDPIAEQLVDPFGGVADVQAKRLRAVGDPLARFTEDGLRVMRAVRFAATLAFDLEPATEAAIAPALPSLVRVSRERVHDELNKLLGAPQPSRGLVPAQRTGILASILPELSPRAGWLDAIDACPAEPSTVRLAVLLRDVAPAAREPALRRLTFANAVRDRAVKLAAAAALGDGAAADERLVRRALAAVGRAGGAEAAAMWRGVGRADLAALADTILARGDALAASDLVLGGGDLIAALALPRGPAVGKLVAQLVDAVLDEPALNTADALLARARALLT